MWMHVSLILNICAVSVAFDLFPNQDKVVIGSVSVDLLWESTPEPGGRDRRSAPVLPGQLAFQFSMGGEKVELNLKRNPDLNTHTPAFVVRGGQVVSSSQYREPATKGVMGYYQDVSKAAAIMVKREVRNQAQYELMGTYIMAEEQYTIQPLRVDHANGSGQRVANHSIARLMTHLSLRNDILDFVRDPATEDIAASTKKSAPEESPANRRRHKRQATVNRVELLIVTDYAVYATWFERTKGSSRAERRSRALENMKQYYAFVINGDPQESLWTVNLAGAQDGGGEFVESSDALESFRSWVLNNDTSFPPNDHVMLFTGYNLTYGGSTANAGLAYIKSMCNPEFSISIVEEFFEFRIVAIAAHELGHSLGARHDMDGNKCFAFFLYIMTSRFRFPSRSKATNPWRFSKCSIDYFRKYIETLNSNNTNCMLTQEANTDVNEIAGFLGDQPGQVYSPDKQCEVRFQSEDSHVCRDGHKDRYTNICSQGLLCRVPGGGGACERIVPADGTPCDKGKWCMEGKCVASTDMLEWRDGCPFGDTPGVLRGAETCQDVVTADPRICYNDTVRLKCCNTCVSVHSGITGCEYGDRQRDCQADLCPSYTFDIQNVSCCVTCHNFFNPTTPTTPGPSTAPTTTTSPLTVSLLTTLTGYVARGSTRMALASSGPFESIGDISTKSEKLMKSELMPTSEIPFTMTTRDTVLTTEQPWVYTSTFYTQGQTRWSADATASPGVSVSSRLSPGSSRIESPGTPTSPSVPVSSNDMATLTRLVTSPHTVQSSPTPMNTLRQSTTSTTSSTDSPNSRANRGGAPSSQIGGFKEMTRKKKLAKLRQLRELHLRQSGGKAAVVVLLHLADPQQTQLEMATNVEDVLETASRSAASTDLLVGT
ncbi:zinc metalloproteinase-disintegrin-like VLAIP-B [Haliotis asinina]|uniref:zinc metalloproteinase-disintegrin-like VLAIP-B n=1 Tax=Haliotis asinina TaxID=109174 RepID=UPI0035323CE2